MLSFCLAFRFFISINRILAYEDYLTYVITNILPFQWQLSLFSFILFVFSASFLFTYTVECIFFHQFTQHKKIQNQCIKVNKIGHAKMNEIFTLAFHTWTTINLRVYLPHCVCGIEFLSNSTLRKRESERKKKCRLDFNELFYILGVWTCSVSSICTGFLNATVTFLLLNWTSVMWNGWMNSWWNVVSVIICFHVHFSVFIFCIALRFFFCSSFSHCVLYSSFGQYCLKGISFVAHTHEHSHEHEMEKLFTGFLSRFKSCHCKGRIHSTTKNPIHELICFEKWLESKNACTTNSYTYAPFIWLCIQTSQIRKAIYLAIVLLFLHFFSTSSNFSSASVSHISRHNLCFLRIEPNLACVFFFSFRIDRVRFFMASQILCTFFNHLWFHSHFRNFILVSYFDWKWWRWRTGSNKT